jgi:hypothetical protein
MTIIAGQIKAPLSLAAKLTVTSASFEYAIENISSD